MSERKLAQMLNTRIEWPSEQLRSTTPIHQDFVRTSNSTKAHIWDDRIEAAACGRYADTSHQLLVMNSKATPNMGVCELCENRITENGIAEHTKTILCDIEELTELKFEGESTLRRRDLIKLRKWLKEEHEQR